MEGENQGKGSEQDENPHKILIEFGEIRSSSAKPSCTVFVARFNLDGTGRQWIVAFYHYFHYSVALSTRVLLCTAKLSLVTHSD